MKQWSFYLEGANHKVLIQCDQKSLEYFQTSKVLCRRQTRWAEILSCYDFVITHFEGKKDSADGPWTGLDYEVVYNRPTAWLLATVAPTTAEPYINRRQEIKTAQVIDALAADVKRRIVGTAIVNVPDLQRLDQLHQDSSNEWKVTAGVLTYEGRIYVPSDDLLHNKVISLSHNKAEYGHFRALQTAELVSRDFLSPAMNATMQQYIARCELCHWMKAHQHAHHRTNMPLPPPRSLPWKGVKLDFVAHLSESTASGYTGILVIVDTLRNIAIYLPCWYDFDSPELAEIFFKPVICKCGVLDNIETDRTKNFASRIWKRVCSHLSIDHRLSTSFHLDADG